MDLDEFITKQMEEFNRRRAMMAYHQRQAFETLFANRAKRVWDAINQPPAKQTTLHQRVWQWLNRRVAAFDKGQTQRHPAAQDESTHVVEAEPAVIEQGTLGDG